MSFPQGLCRDLLDHFYEGVYFLDLHKRIVYWNKSAEVITGYSGEAAHVDCSSVLAHLGENGEPLCGSLCPVTQALGDGRMREAEVFFRHKAGHRIPVSVRIIPIRDDAAGTVAGVVEIFVDKSPHAALHRELEQLKDKANLDKLTALFARAYGEILLEAKLNEYHKGGQQAGILFLDIDHFKTVNDIYGHDIGDLVLKMVARTLASNVRAGDYVIRWGGEEMVIVLPGCGDLAGLSRIADQLRTLVQQSEVTVLQQKIAVTISIGATLLSRQDSVESVINRADSLMYQSKRAGRNQVTAG